MSAAARSTDSCKAAVRLSMVAIVAVASLPLPAAPSWPFILASGLIHIFYNLGLVYAYRCGDLGVTYPIARGSSPLLVALGAALVTGEHLGPIKVIGVCLVSAGIITLVLQRGHFSRSGSVAALATGVMIALYTVVDGVGVRRSGDSMSYIAWTFLFYLFMPVLFLMQRNVKALRAPVRDIASSAVGGLVSIAAYGIVVWAMQFDAMGVVSAIREISIVFAVIIGRLFMHEELTLKRFLSCVVIVIGAICLGS